MAPVKILIDEDVWTGLAEALRQAVSGSDFM